LGTYSQRSSKQAFGKFVHQRPHRDEPDALLSDLIVTLPSREGGAPPADHFQL
jgi:hypothetical protein